MKPEVQPNGDDDGAKRKVKRIATNRRGGWRGEKLREGRKPTSPRMALTSPQEFFSL